MADAQAWPTEIRISADHKTLSVTYDDGRSDTLRAEFLRVESPSAEVQGHTPSQKVIIGGKREVTITGAVPVGAYAARLTFNDGHSTGIFTWDYLRRLAENHDSLWTTYLNALAERGLTR